jgi:hypothetical protein
MASTLQVQLTAEQRSELIGLRNHRGYAVLKLIMESECKRATEDCIKCDPTKDKEVLALQSNARATNQFCTRVLAGIEWEVNEGLFAAQEDEAEVEAE